MVTRLTSTYSTPSSSKTLDPLRPPFEILSSDRSYKQQYANLYWLRLAVLRPKVELKARKLWENMKGVNVKPEYIKKVLDVESGKLCFIIGTIYMEMLLKPNVLEDLAREHYIALPEPRRKFNSESDEVMLEDESGRVRLVGAAVSQGGGTFVTGTIMGALGAETPSGDFEVLEFCYAGLPIQTPLPKSIESESESESKSKSEEGEWIALISGLELSGENDESDIRIMLLSEWLLGELGDVEGQEQATKISRVVIAGNSLSQPTISTEEVKKPKRYGYDSSTYSSNPTSALDSFLAEILPSIPVDLMSGSTDPVGPTLPQQALHSALLEETLNFKEDRFQCRTNPFWFDSNGCNFLGTSGQPLDDIFKYLQSENRLEMALKTLEWQHLAPTCPDTLWCYPFSDRDPFIIQKCPHVYFIGNQPKFETCLIKSPSSSSSTNSQSMEIDKENVDEGGEEEEKKQVRIILLPKFKETGEIVLVNNKTLECRVIQFGVKETVKEIVKEEVKEEVKMEL